MGINNDVMYIHTYNRIVPTCIFNARHDGVRLLFIFSEQNTEC